MRTFIKIKVSNQLFINHATHSTCSASHERNVSTLHELPFSAHGLGIGIHSIPAGFNAKSTQRESLLHLDVVSRLDDRIQQRLPTLRESKYTTPPLAFDQLL